MTDLNETGAMAAHREAVLDDDQLAGLESAVWNRIGQRRKRSERMMLATGALAFVLLFAGSYGVGATQGSRLLQHHSLAIELAQGGSTFGERF